MDSATPPAQPRPDGYVQSFERGLAVLTAFSAQSPRLTLSEVARACDITRAAARRYLITLETLGYVGSDGRDFFLLPRVLELGYAYLSSSTVADVAQAHLAPLASRLGESCSASVLDRDEVVYIARASTNRIMSIALAVGTRLPAYCTSMGRVLLAALPDDELDAYFGRVRPEALTRRTITDPAALRGAIARARDLGWAAVDQELEEGVRSVAVPVQDSQGVVIAAMNVSVHASRISMDELESDVLDQARECAAAIDDDLRIRRV